MKIFQCYIAVFALREKNRLTVLFPTAENVSPPLSNILAIFNNI